MKADELAALRQSHRLSMEALRAAYPEWPEKLRAATERAEKILCDYPDEDDRS